MAESYKVHYSDLSKPLKAAFIAVWAVIALIGLSTVLALFTG